MPANASKISPNISLCLSVHCFALLTRTRAFWYTTDDDYVDLYRSVMEDVKVRNESAHALESHSLGMALLELPLTNMFPSSAAVSRAPVVWWNCIALIHIEAPLRRSWNDNKASLLFRRIYSTDTCPSKLLSAWIIASIQHVSARDCRLSSE